MSRRRRWLEAEIADFIREYARKHGANSCGPNDRQYDHKTQQIVRRMKPEDLDDLIYGRA